MPLFWKLQDFSFSYETENRSILKNYMNLYRNYGAASIQTCINYQLQPNSFELSTIQLENYYSSPMCVIIIETPTQKSFELMLINDSLCHFDHCFVNPCTH